MKEFKLISMPDFVFEQKKRSFYGQIESSEILQTIYNYTEFLKQPLTLGMFVPCDEDGNVWKYPPTKEEWEWAEKDSVDAEQSFKQKEYHYKKAKEKVLFKGFEVKENIYDESGLSLFIGWESYNSAIFLKLANEDWKLDDFKTIEDLITSGYEIELTESAINQLGL